MTERPSNFCFFKIYLESKKKKSEIIVQKLDKHEKKLLSDTEQIFENNIIWEMY